MLLADTFQAGYDVKQDKVIRLSIRWMTRIILKEYAGYCEFKENNCNPLSFATYRESPSQDIYILVKLLTFTCALDKLKTIFKTGEGKMRKIVYAVLMIAGMLLVLPPLTGAEVATQPVVKEKSSKAPAAKKVQQPKATEKKTPVKPMAIKLEGC